MKASTRTDCIPLLRRELLGHTATAAYALFLVACGKKTVTCAPAALSPENAKLRKTLKYLDSSPDPAKTCRQCQQYLPADGCGTCKLLPGPIHPTGTCAVFVSVG